MAEFAFYRRTRIVRVNDLLVDRMNMVNPEYPCLHCGVPVMDHVSIDIDSCTLRDESTECVFCGATTERTCFICVNELVCDNCWPHHIRSHYRRVKRTDKITPRSR